MQSLRLTMAHLRNRYFKDLVLKIIGFSPLTGVLGHRQVGKTTVLEMIAHKYFSLDDRETLMSIKSDAEGFLAKNNLLRTALDESQLEPALFPALKECVRKNKKPGQYILSGSVRFTSRKSIRESLTGRIINLEVLPFSISELHKRELPTITRKLNLTKLLSSMKPQIQQEIQSKKILKKEISVYLKKGGLPGICFIRDSGLLNSKIREQLFTLLDRDIRLIYPTTVPYSQILELVKFLSIHEGEIISYSEAQRATDISLPTIKKLLAALESIFLIRLIPTKNGEKGFLAIFEDQAEALHLYPEKALKTQLEGLVYRNIRLEFYYQLESTFSFFHYSTRGGARVPFAVEFEGAILGFIIMDSTTPSKSEFSSANSFLKTFNNSKIVFLEENADFKIHSERILQLPLHTLF